MKTIDTLIFDLGGVLIDWNPDHLYKKILPEASDRARFYKDICTPDWNEEQDAGRPIAEATEALVGQFPEHEELIRAYYGRWEEMLNGPIQGTVDVMREVKNSGKYKLIALTNWSAETFPIALERYDFLQWFDGRVVSGEEKTRKPFPEIYQTLISRYAVLPHRAVYIDDNERNLKPAAELGMETIHFREPGQFRRDLNDLGIL